MLPTKPARDVFHSRFVVTCDCIRYRVLQTNTVGAKEDVSRSMHPCRRFFFTADPASGKASSRAAHPLTSCSTSLSENFIRLLVALRSGPPTFHNIREIQKL